MSGLVLMVVCVGTLADKPVRIVRRVPIQHLVPVIELHASML